MPGLSTTAHPPPPPPLLFWTIFRLSPCKLSIYETFPCNKFAFIKLFNSYILLFSDDVECETVFDDPATSLPADIMSLVQTSTNMSELFTSIRTSVSEAQSQLIFDLTKGQSSDDLWRQVRHNRVTASKMGDVIR